MNEKIAVYGIGIIAVVVGLAYLVKNELDNLVGKGGSNLPDLGKNVGGAAVGLVVGAGNAIFDETGLQTYLDKSAVDSGYTAAVDATKDQLGYDQARQTYAFSLGMKPLEVEGTAGWPWGSFDAWKNSGYPALP